MFPFIHRRTIEQVHTAGERFHPGVWSSSAGKGKGTQSIQWKSNCRDLLIALLDATPLKVGQQNCSDPNYRRGAF